MRSKHLENSIVPRPQPGFAEEVVDSELVLYHAETAQAFYLNPTATIVWRLCDGKRSIGEIVEVIQAAYPDNGAIEDDVHSAIFDFRNYGAVQAR